MKQTVSLYAGLLRTVAFTAVVILVADLFSQIVIQRTPVVDARRAARSFVIGLVYAGPVQLLSFTFLDWLVGNAGLSATLTKVLLGQLVIGPLAILGFMFFNGALQRLPLAAILHDISTKYMAVLKARLVFWPAAQGAIFQFVPVEYRHLGVSVAFFLWSSFMSWKTNGLGVTPQPSTNRVRNHRTD